MNVGCVPFSRFLCCLNRDTRISPHDKPKQKPLISEAHKQTIERPLDQWHTELYGLLNNSNQNGTMSDLARLKDLIENGASIYFKGSNNESLLDLAARRWSEDHQCNDLIHEVVAHHIKMKKGFNMSTQTLKSTILHPHSPFNNFPTDIVRNIASFSGFPDNVKFDDHETSFYLGLYYRKKNELGLAFDCFRRSAEAGYSYAQYQLGCLYETGEWVDRDESMAVEWYIRAASQGHADAQYQLGELCKTGSGGDQDESMAVEWYVRAAENGHDKALFSLIERDTSKVSQKAVDQVRSKIRNSNEDISKKVENLYKIVDFQVKFNEQQQAFRTLDDIKEVLNGLNPIYRLQPHYQLAKKQFDLGMNVKAQSTCIDIHTLFNDLDKSKLTVQHKEVHQKSLSLRSQINSQLINLKKVNL